MVSVVSVEGSRVDSTPGIVIIELFKSTAMYAVVTYQVMGLFKTVRIVAESLDLIEWFECGGTEPNPG